MRKHKNKLSSMTSSSRQISIHLSSELLEGFSKNSNHSCLHLIRDILTLKPDSLNDGLKFFVVQLCLMAHGLLSRVQQNTSDLIVDIHDAQLKLLLLVLDCGNDFFFVFNRPLIDIFGLLYIPIFDGLILRYSTQHFILVHVDLDQFAYYKPRQQFN